MTEKSNTQKIIVITATLITILVLALFLILSIDRKLYSLKLNEIADSIAGFTSFLAFLWLIVAVILQSIELNLQRKEITGLNKSSNDQAESLKLTNKLHALNYIRQKQMDYDNSIKNRVDNVREFAYTFIKEYSNLKYKGDFANNPRASITELIAYFFEPTDKIYDSNFKVKPVKDFLYDTPFRKDYDIEAYFIVTNITIEMKYVWDMIKGIYSYAQNTNILDEYFSWEASIGIAWYKDFYPLLIDLNKRLDKYNLENGIGNKVFLSQLAIDDYITTNQEKLYEDFEKDGQKILDKFGIKEKMNPFKKKPDDAVFRYSQ